MMNKNFTTINGTEVDVTTVMDKTIQYIPSQEEIDSVKEEVTELLKEYFEDVFDSGYGLDTMFNSSGEFWFNKGWLITAFKKHPDYNGNLQIVLKNQNLCRHINTSDVEGFKEYIESLISKQITYTIKGHVLTEEKRMEYFELTRHLYLECDYGPEEDIFREAKRVLRRATPDMNEKLFFVRDSLDYILNYVINNSATLVDETIVEAVEINAKDYNIKFNMHVGEKITRLVGKLAKLVGFDKDVNIQDTSFIRQDGELVTRTKDLGWNYQFARFCDAISPIIQKGTLVISVHPYDFLTMSFGKNWASCHTIDKDNRRNVGNHNYHGCYCGGTESYMLDESSIIVYSLPEDWDGEHPEYEDKIKRCVFYLGEDKLIQSRVYPDGRDGGDNSLAGDIRASVQKVIAEIFDVPNYWTNSKGTSACIDAIDTYGVHYQDYAHYDDCNVSFMKRIDGHKNHIKIRVGHDPICPECGEEHETEDNIFCENCLDTGACCYNCGEYHRYEEMCQIDGEYYCGNCTFFCECCQETRPIEGSEFVDDDPVCERCIRDYYTWSDYHERYISDSYVVETQEGRICEEGEGGYEECYECGEYHNDELMHYDAETNHWYCNDCYEALLAEREEIEEVEDEEE